MRENVQENMQINPAGVKLGRHLFVTVCSAGLERGRKCDNLTNRQWRRVWPNRTLRTRPVWLPSWSVCLFSLQTRPDKEKRAEAPFYKPRRGRADWRKRRSKTYARLTSWRRRMD